MVENHINNLFHNCLIVGKIFVDRILQDRDTKAQFLKKSWNQISRKKVYLSILTTFYRQKK